MPKIETPENFYEQEQIDEAKEWFGAFIGRKNYGLHEKYGVCLLSALSTAERERDTLKAQVAELEARLQGAADRAVEWVEADPVDHRGLRGNARNDLRAAIIGKKEG